MENNESCCIGRLLKVIELLQNNTCDNSCPIEGCNKPFLGPTVPVTNYNTRPVNLYTLDGSLLTITYNGNNESSIFRVECVDNCCCKLRILANSNSSSENDDNNPDAQTSQNNVITNTNEFVTVNLRNISAVSCLPDIALNI